MCSILGFSIAIPHFLHMIPHKDSTEILWQSTCEWEITLWWSNAQRATSVELLAFLWYQWHKGVSILWTIDLLDFWFFFKCLWTFLANIFYARPRWEIDSFCTYGEIWDKIVPHAKKGKKYLYSLIFEKNKTLLFFNHLPNKSLGNKRMNFSVELSPCYAESCYSLHELWLYHTVCIKCTA